MTTHKHYQAAYAAHYNTSFSPEKRAESECAFFDEICDEFKDHPRIIEKFERLFTASLASKSRCLSSMITGPARFPVARAEKANQRERAASDKLLHYINTMREILRRERLRETNTEAFPIASNDPDALTKLRAKLATLEKNQETMKAVNATLRKKPVDTAALANLLGSKDAAEKVMRPDPWGGVGFASYALSNNNANIKATRDRIAEIEKRKAAVAKDITINGVRCLENTEDMRLQLFFVGKPAPETIALLKKHGFKWAPSKGAWQRQLTNNAIWTFNNYILSAIKSLQE